jgi:hypothetical protein
LNLPLFSRLQGIERTPDSIELVAQLAIPALCGNLDCYDYWQELDECWSLGDFAHLKIKLKNFPKI